MGSLFRNPKGAVYAIAAFVAILLLGFAISARGDETLSFEGGSTMLRGETPTIGLNIACPLCGPVNTDYEFGFDLIGESSENTDNPNVIQLHAQIVDGWKNAEIGFGFYYQNVETEYVCQFGFHLLARYRFTERVSLQWRHSSSAGSCRPNAGRDLLTIGWRF